MVRVGLILACLASTAQSAPDVRCGLHCLYVALRAVDLPVPSLDDLERKLGKPSAAGYSLGQLQDAAQVYGAHTLAVQTTLERLSWRERPFAVIAHVDGAHFLNLASFEPGLVKVVDAPNSATISPEVLAQRWNGTALLIASQPLVPEESLRAPISWGRWLAGILLTFGAAGAAWRLLVRRRTAMAAVIALGTIAGLPGCEETSTNGQTGWLRFPLREIECHQPQSVTLRVPVSGIVLPRHPDGVPPAATTGDTA